MGAVGGCWGMDPQLLLFVCMLDGLLVQRQLQLPRLLRSLLRLLRPHVCACMNDCACANVSVCVRALACTGRVGGCARARTRECVCVRMNVCRHACVCGACFDLRRREPECVLVCARTTSCFTLTSFFSTSMCLRACICVRMERCAALRCRHMHAKAYAQAYPTLALDDDGVVWPSAWSCSLAIASACSASSALLDAACHACVHAM